MNRKDKKHTEIIGTKLTQR